MCTIFLLFIILFKDATQSFEKKNPVSARFFFPFFVLRSLNWWNREICFHQAFKISTCFFFPNGINFDFGHHFSGRDRVHYRILRTNNIILQAIHFKTAIGSIKLETCRNGISAGSASKMILISDIIPLEDAITEKIGGVEFLKYSTKCWVDFHFY